MQKKAVWIVLGALLATMIASVALVFAVGPKTSADSEPTIGILDDASYFTISGTTLTGLSSAGEAYAANYDQLKVVIPDTVTTLGSNIVNSIFGATYRTKVTSVTIPSSVTCCNNFAFNACSELETVNYFGTLDQWVEIDFKGVYGNPLSYAKKLSIDGKEITNAVISNGVTSIGQYAFCKYSGLVSVTIPSSVTSIGFGAFYDCSNLTSVEISAGVISVSSSAFYNCTSLTSVNFLGTVDQWAPINFGDSYANPVRYAKKLSIDGKEITNAVISDGVTSISSYAFVNCNSLTSIVIPSSVSTIGANAFGNWSDTQTIYCEAESKPDGWNTNWKTGGPNVVWGYQVVPTDYIVTFNSNGGSAVESQTVEIDGVASEPTDPTKTGYTFGGWYTDAVCTNAYDFSATVTENLTLYAKWNPVPYTVTFNVDGVVYATKTVNYNAKVTAPATDPTKEGYDFMYWYTDDESTEFDFGNTAITADTTIYAKWEKQTFTVTFMADGVEYDNQTVDYNATVTVPTQPTKENYNFIGWYTTEDTLFDLETPITQSMTLHAEWSQSQCVVTFVDDDGTVWNLQTETGEPVALPTPTKEGYDFVGWYTDEDCTQAYNDDDDISGNLTLYAKWQIKTYTVTFDVNGMISSQTVEHGSMADAPELPTRDGYTFIGWYTENSKQFDVEATAITADTNLHAVWGLNRFIVDFVTNGGNTVKSQTVDSNSKVERPADPTQDGYTFAGWYADETLENVYDFSSPVTENLTLYAKWEPLNVTETSGDAPEQHDYVGVVAGSVGGVFLLGLLVGLIVSFVIKKNRESSK